MLDIPESLQKGTLLLKNCQLFKRSIRSHFLLIRDKASVSYQYTFPVLLRYS